MYEIIKDGPINPAIIYEKQRKENHIRDNMDLTLAIKELEKIIEGHLLGIEFKTPPITDIVAPEHIVFQKLLKEARTIYASHMECRTQTEEELEERRIDFTKNIQPFVNHFSKLIYSLIKQV